MLRGEQQYHTSLRQFAQNLREIFVDALKAKGCSNAPTNLTASLCL